MPRTVNSKYGQILVFLIRIPPLPTVPRTPYDHLYQVTFLPLFSSSDILMTSFHTGLLCLSSLCLEVSFCVSFFVEERSQQYNFFSCEIFHLYRHHQTLLFCTMYYTTMYYISYNTRKLYKLINLCWSTGCFVKLHFTPRSRGVQCNFTKQPVDQHRLINLYNLHV